MPTEHLHHWFSPALSAEIKVLAFGHRGYPVIVFPTSMGRFFEAKDAGLLRSVNWFLDEGLVKIYCVDGIDSMSWYNKSIHPADRVRNHQFYDQMVLQELVPFCQYETGVQQVAVAGCSFGGYHATNFAFRHPEVVKYVFNMSANFDIKPQLDGYYSDAVYFNNPVDFIPNASADAFRHLFVVLGTGEHDICKDANLHMAHVLGTKNIPHWLDLRPGANHDWPVWQAMFPHYLSLIR